MAQRTGIPTLILVAHQMCKYIVKFTPIITTLYPENEVVLAALAAANTACAALGAALQPLRSVETYP